MDGTSLWNGILSVENGIYARDKEGRKERRNERASDESPFCTHSWYKRTDTKIKEREGGKKGGRERGMELGERGVKKKMESWITATAAAAAATEVAAGWTNGSSVGIVPRDYSVDRFCLFTLKHKHDVQQQQQQQQQQQSGNIHQ